MVADVAMYASHLWKVMYVVVLKAICLALIIEHAKRFHFLHSLPVQQAAKEILAYHV